MFTDGVTTKDESLEKVAEFVEPGAKVVIKAVEALRAVCEKAHQIAGPIRRVVLVSLEGLSIGRTCATNFCSSADGSSFRQIRKNRTGKSKSITGNKVTPRGHCQRVVSLTNATPSLHATRLRVVA